MEALRATAADWHDRAQHLASGGAAASVSGALLTGTALLPRSLRDRPSIVLARHLRAPRIGSADLAQRGTFASPRSIAIP